MCPPKLLLPLWRSPTHVIYCSSGQAHSSFQTASRSVQPFLYGSQMLCCTMQMGKKMERNPTKNAPFPWDFVTLPEEDRSMAAQFSLNCICFLNLSPINAKLISLSYVHASMSLVYLFLRQRSPLPQSQ